MFQNSPPKEPFILTSMAIRNLIFKANSSHHRFIPSVEVEKQTLPQLKVRSQGEKEKRTAKLVKVTK